MPEFRYELKEFPDKSVNVSAVTFPSVAIFANWEYVPLTPDNIPVNKELPFNLLLITHSFHCFQY